MGSLVLPGPQAGPKGPPEAKRERGLPPFSQWFPGFLRDELKPYPGRGMLALRYVAAATITMLVIMTFRLPGAAVGGFYSLLLPRDSPLITARSALTVLSAFTISLVFALVGAMLFVDYPLTHFLWVAGSFFVGFYALSAITNYAAASAFTILIVLAIPAWDVPVPTAAVVITNLWTAGSVAIAILATIVVEVVFSLFDPKDQLEEGLRDRLSALGKFLHENSVNALEPKTTQRLQMLATVGVSRLRRIAIGGSRHEADLARRSTAVSLVGRLVDIAASYEAVEQFTPKEKPRMEALAKQVKALESKLLRGFREPIRETVEHAYQDEKPVLFELERTVELLAFSLSPSQEQSNTIDAAGAANPPIFRPDAWSNPVHLNFALRGCLAATICYFILNAVAWPGLGTSLFTCVVTALTSIGSSRQKQMLRISGAILGGVVLGIGSQVLILPMLDTILGFTVMFVAVTSLAAWFITASPRISYFGSQLALAFFLIHLRGPSPQTNIAIARDNVIGILLGLVVMWIVFDTLGSKPAVQVMRELFGTNLKLMAELAKPWPQGRPADLKHIRTLREKISENFGAVNAQADAVLFELGRSRSRSLALRNALLGWQPRLRTLFLVEVALLQYRTQVSPAELPEGILISQIKFDHEISDLLREMSKGFAEGKVVRDAGRAQLAFQGLNDAIQSAYEGKVTARAQAVLSLSSHLVDVSTSLAGEMH